METILFDMEKKMQDIMDDQDAEDNTPVFFNKGRKRGDTKYPGYITRDAIYSRVGAGNYIAFRAACKKVGVKGIVNDGHRCYIPIDYAEAVENAMKHIMGMA